MAGQAVQVGSGYIRVIAKTLPQDYQDFKRRWQQGLEQALGSLNLSTPIISPQVAAQQGQQAGTQLGQQLTQSAQQQVQQSAPQVTAPIAQGGNNTGAKLGLAVAAGFIASKAGSLISKGLQQAMEVESGGKKLQASLGLSPEDAARLGETAGDLYKGAYGDSLEEINGAMGSVISSIDGMRGASNEAIGDMTKKALGMSKTFEVDVARSTQVVGQMVKTGLVKDANEGFDLLTAGMQKLPVNVREGLLDANDEYAQFFATMGIDGEEAINMLVASGQKLGEFGLDKLGDSIKEFGIRAADGSKGTLETYKALGLSGKEMTQSFVKGGDDAEKAFDQVTARLLAVKDPAKQAQLAISLFGTPLEDLNTAEIEGVLQSFQGTTDAIGETTGAADEMVKVMGEGLEGSMKAAQNSMQMALGEIALPLMQAILPVVQDLAKWLSENNDLIVAWGGPLLTIGLVIGGIVSVVSAFSAVAGVLVPIIKALIGVQWAWNAALFANPITLWVLAIAALIGLIALLVFNWDGVVDFFITSINWIMEAFQNLGKWIADLFNPLGGFLETLFGGGNFNVTGSMSGSGSSGAGSLPMMANGGMVPYRPGGTPVIISEKANEIVMNESTYNKNMEAQTNLTNSLQNNGNGINQTNYFTHVDPRHAEKVITTQLNQKAGY